MAVEMGLWRADGDKLSRIVPTALGLESQLETYIESDPTMLGETLLIIGRQVSTAHGGFIDLLALDETAAVHVIELKRDKTPRDVTAQALDYGSWVSTLSRTDIHTIFEAYRPGVALEEAFAERFNETLPEEVNSSQVFTIVAASVDAATERIVRFLNEDFGVPINVVFFRHFTDNGASYLARTWLVEHDGQTTAQAASLSRKTKTREPWNGSDWYVSFGERTGGRQWSDGRKYGFVSGGGGKWFSQTLKNLTPGARVFACIPKVGYVGVGTVTGEARRFDEAVVSMDGVGIPLKDLPLEGDYRHEDGGDDLMAEWVVPIVWTHTVPSEQGFWKAGMFANQNTAAKLRQQFTIEQVSAAFGLDS
ncbi:endonuclease NucS [Salinibacterium sp. G-O1]|uniref:endonuclease NucS domain-containing protein n=1 Tax=Salinibacterium sp. G-O1 TaxID=3046208 RepID=UPI0024B9639D|nr:endonuclease NucS domain-containing protein [Salinibacterium sp. G-O1]MDJ0334900.1 endonuclease NucS [Salinibacterium sp. G-O1]